MFVAHELGMSEGEVLQFAPDEMARWIAYFNLRAKYEAKAAKEAQKKAKQQYSGGRGRRRR